MCGGGCSAVYLLLHKHGLPSQPLHALKAIQSLLVLHTKLGGGGRGGEGELRDAVRGCSSQRGPAASPHPHLLN